MVLRTLGYCLIVSMILAGVLFGASQVHAVSLHCNYQPLYDGQENADPDDYTRTRFGLRFVNDDTGADYIPYWSSSEEAMTDGNGVVWYPCGHEDDISNADPLQHTTRLLQDITLLPEGNYTVYAVAYNGWGFSGPSVPLPLGKFAPGEPVELKFTFADN